MNALVHQLQHVLVARYDHDIKVLARAPCHGPDHIVGFEARVLQHWNAQGIEQTANIGDLLAQVRRHLGTIGLVARKLLFAERLARFENRRDVFGLIRRPQLPHHIVEDEHGLGGNARGGAHGRSPAARAGVIRAEDKPVAIDQEQPGTVLGAFRGGGGRHPESG